MVNYKFKIAIVDLEYMTKLGPNCTGRRVYPVRAPR